MENPFNEKEILAGMQQSGERLITLGYAEKCVIDDGTGMGRIIWTPAGTSLRRELQKLYDLIARGNGQAGKIEFMAFLSMLIDMD